MEGKSIALIFAGGDGKRMKGNVVPKQFVELQGKPIVAYTLERFQEHAQIDGIVLVALNGWIDYCASMAKAWKLDKIAAIVPGGASSQESIRLGLEAASELYPSDSIVLIHDGVRPLIDAQTISRCIQGVRQYDTAITVSPQMETAMIEGPEGGRYRIIERSRCRVARAPQCFYLEDILDAHRRALEEHKLQFIDCASMMEYYGHALYPVLGPIDNIKITTELDLRVFHAILEERELSV